MEQIDNIQQYKIYVDASPSLVSSDSWDFTHKDGTLQTFPEFDFQIPVFLRRSYEVCEYVDVAKESDIIPIQRQQFNPYFIEFSFFDEIKRNRINNGVELTVAMINFIKIRRPDVAHLNSNDLKKWFDDIGKNEFPWNKGTSNETTFNDIDEVNFISSNVVSKAKYFGIDINK